MDMGAEADEHGKFFAKRHVPFDALPGAHRVEALGQESGLRARTIFVMRTDWPQYRENDQGTGNKDFENLVTPATVGGLAPVWTAPTSCCYVAPVVAGGVVYLSTYSAMTALDARSGGLLWSTAPGDVVDLRPTVADGRVFAGHVHVYAFDTASGHLLWDHPPPADGIFAGSSLVWRGEVLVPGTSFVAALDEETGRTIWSLGTGYTDQLVLDDGIIYFRAVGLQNAWIDAVDARSGKLLWQSQEIGANWSVGPIVTDHAVFALGGSAVFAFDKRHGGILWTTPLLSPGHIAEAHGLLYASASDQLVALKADDGTIAWTIPADQYADWALPAVAGGVLYARTTADGMSAYDAQTGTFLWTSNLGVGVGISAPVIVDGYLYFAADDYLLHAYALPDTT